ncbi:FAD-dependent oxidoreductase [Streptomyces sp. NPDC057565]|uniref:FAD-dependent oxidoreductase n=1 Tax=Streptomyces sp. NPDC057565 TaxID=3346169 RepID=UPI00368E0DB6
MTTQHVVILGAGSAGAAAAQELAKTDGVTVTLVGRTGETPYNRTLVNKGVAVGLLTPEQASLPTPGASLVADTAQFIDTGARTVRLASGAALDFDALIVATGSTPRDLDALVPGADAATAAGRLTSLHSLSDAVRLRDLLAHRSNPARVVIFGAGLVAAETASLLHQKGHEITLVARSPLPGATAFGDDIAATIAAAHHENVSTAFGRTPATIRVDGDGLDITLDDQADLRADLAIVALGTTPSGPAPWAAGVQVDDRLRAHDDGVYAAGGVAIHHDALLGTWRIDHWADAAAQGKHAAGTLLHDLGLATDPGPYLPCSPYTSVVYGNTVAAIGFTGGQTRGHAVTSQPLVVVHEHQGVPVGAAGVDAAPAVFEWLPQLHAKRAITSNSPAVYNVTGMTCGLIGGSDRPRMGGMGV